jgi:hypothetical protein
MWPAADCDGAHEAGAVVEDGDGSGRVAGDNSATGGRDRDVVRSGTPAETLENDAVLG